MAGETILVIDDNRLLGSFIAESLLPSLGYQSGIVYTGSTALAYIRENKPALLLVDLELPDTSGLELLRQLNHDGLTIPAILFTAHGSEQIAIEAFRLGVEDYLIKPIDPEQLGVAIARALENTRLQHEKSRLVTELNEQVNWLFALSKIGQSVTSSLELDEVLRRIVEAAVQLTQADEGFLALLDHASGALHLRASKNIEGQITSSLRLPVADSLLGEAMATGKPMRRSAPQSTEPIKIGTGLLVNSLLNVPILSKGHPLGVLSVDNRKKLQPFTQSDEVLLTSLADYAAVALENAGLYQQARHEISERKRIEAALRESEERYALAARGANDGIWDLDLKKNTLYLSPRWKAMVGYQDDEIGEDPNDWFKLIHPDDTEALKSALNGLITRKTPHMEIEYRIHHKDGVYRWVVCRGVAVQGLGGDVGRIAGSQSDISERKAVESRLLHDAFHDKLTDLPNRTLILDQLQKAIHRAQQQQDYSFAVLFLDLDEFKDVNDSLGHPAGDQLLISVGRLLKSTLRRSDMVARLGGDEFVILLDGIRDGSDAVEKSKEIIAALQKPAKLGKQSISISTSIGIVLNTLGYTRPEDMLRDADIAMYAAKSRGKSSYQVFDPKMRREIMQRISLEAELQTALEERQLQVKYQPIIGLSDGALIGFEALVQWNHPRRGLLSAREFLHLAQETGQLLHIDSWVLEEACRQVQAWQQQFRPQPPLIVSVNLGGSLLMHADFLASVQKSLETAAFPVQNLVLEIAESVASLNIEELGETLASLKAAGIRVQIDDFGRGNSILQHLNRLQANALKIDQSFIEMISEDERDSEILSMLISMAHKLGFKAVAEGIENPLQLSRLREMGCDYGQGYLLCGSLGTQAAEGLLEAIKPGGPASSPWSTYW